MEGKMSKEADCVRIRNLIDYSSTLRRTGSTFPLIEASKKYNGIIITASPQMSRDLHEEGAQTFYYLQDHHYLYGIKQPLFYDKYTVERMCMDLFSYIDSLHKEIDDLQNKVDDLEQGIREYSGH
jgi:hypothetical protein